MNKKISIEELSNRVLQELHKKHRDKSLEIMVVAVKELYTIYTIKNDLKVEMWVYENGIYIPHGKSCVKELCRVILKKAYSSQLSNAVISRIEVDTYIKQEDFFKEKYIDEIPVQNGILNIQTKKLSPFTPKKIFFGKIPVKYDSKAKCQKITNFFEDVLREKEDVLVMFELAGFGLLKEYRYEKAVMFSGFGRNGKGKSILLLKMLVGSENCASIPIHALKHDSFAICELFGKLFNLGGDLSSIDFKETSVFKGLTGRDPINAKRKFLSDLIFQNYAKMVFACNELPKVYDFSEGFWSRWILLDFPYKFVPKKEYEKTPKNERKFLKIMDPQIIEKVATPEELSGFLNEALKGLERLQKNRDFSYTKGSAEIKEEWVRKSDSFTAFCMDCLVDNPEGVILKSDLRKAFHKYCKKYKVIRGSSDKNIKVILQEMFGAIEDRITVNEIMSYVWEGIGFNPKYQGCYGFSTYIKNVSFTLGANYPSNLSILNKKNNNSFEKCYRCGGILNENEIKLYKIGNNFFHKNCYEKMKEVMKK